MKLDTGVPMFVMQFFMGKPILIPKVIRLYMGRYIDEESDEDQVARSNRNLKGDGQVIIDSTDKCSVLDLLKGLELRGYEMANVFCQKRTNLNNSMIFHYILRVIFVRKDQDFIEIPEKFIKIRDSVGKEVQDLCEESIWKIKVFSNSFKNGTETSDKRSAVVTLGSRKPLLCKNGEPITVWERNEKGHREGLGPVPLKPDCSLHFVGDAVSLTEYH